jgi:hypothetical protein
LLFPLKLFPLQIVEEFLMRYPQKRQTLAGALLTAGFLCLPLSAQALSITPATVPVWTTTQNSELTAAEVSALVGYSPLALVYKADQGGGDSGNAAGLYSTVFDITPDDPSKATITWDSTTQFIACPTCYLVVKDGNQTPAQYIFDISTWNGQESIVLTGFWPAQGAISNIAIYNNPGDGGGTIAQVPEADTYAMLLAGLGLVGFAARRKLN